MNNFLTPRRSFSLRRNLTVGFALVASFGLACSTDKDGEDSGKTDMGSAASGNGASGNDGSGSGASGNGASGNGATGNGASGNGATGNGAGSSRQPDDACGLANANTSGTGDGNGVGNNDPNPAFDDCSGISYEGEAVPADILILLDRSSSMGDRHIIASDEDSPTRWEAITEALTAFINDPSTEDLRVGIQYFPQYDGAKTVCEKDAYAEPSVPIALVTDDHKQALLDSIDGQFPSGFTPAVPAVAGALAYAKDWAENNPERPTMLVWAADGYPTDPTEDVDGCDDITIGSLEALAEEYATGSPRVGTFVVGLAELPNLKRVAQKGGTERAFFVSECETAVEDLLASLKRVSSSPALCEFHVPEPEDGGLVDTNLVNVTFTPDGGKAEIVYRVASSADCTSGGWYYSGQAMSAGGASGASEEHIIRVCPQTCGRFGGGTVDIVVGCQTFELN